MAITSSAYGFCPGESVVISAPAGYDTYQWSNGVTGVNSITVTNGGNYSILVTNAEGCVGSSNILSVVEILGEEPTIEVDGSLNLCDGGTIQMSASEAESWVWSTGEVTQTINVTSEGIYSVSTLDICSNESVSAEYTVTLFDSPVGPPEVSDLVIVSGDDATFEAVGENISWYDSETGGAQIGFGPTYTIPSLTNDVTVWASASHITSGASSVGGELTNQSTGAYHSNSSRWLEFDVYEDMLISSVTVFANGAYDRTFELIDGSNNVLASTTVFVEDGEFVLDLNFEVPVGVGYGLRSTTSDPQLWREGTGSVLSYPYALGNVASITNSTAGPQFSYYYFFYNWQVAPLPIACESVRISAHATIACADCLGCPEDLNGDGFISIVDLLLILSDFGCLLLCESDINQDGSVAVDDLLIVLSVFGNTCE